MSSNHYLEKESVQTRKPRGAFFTPAVLAQFVSKWAVRSSSDRVYEPSCGEAAFLLAAADALKALGDVDSGSLLAGVDIFETSVLRARQVLDSTGIETSISLADFFSVPVPEVSQQYDVVIGNPPYIRYQQFSGESRARALVVAQQQGVKLSGLASSWAAFIVHSTAFLKPEGRLGLVIPAELLSVNYAEAIRRFLLSRFKKIRLVLFEAKVFPEVQEEVLLLLAEGSGGSDSFEVFQAHSAEDLAKIEPESWMDYKPKGPGKWTAALVPREALHIYRSILGDSQFEPFGEWGGAYLGSVTGNNSYFTLTPSQAKKYGIGSSELVKISPSGSSHLKGFQFSTDSFDRLIASDKKCFAFYPGTNPSENAQKYIALGESQQVPLGYKCSQRAPWWRIPLVAKPDLIFTYMNHIMPHLVENVAGVHILNGVYGFRLKSDRVSQRQMLPLAFLNSLTLLGAEVVGRSFGGGLLKHEPRDVDQIPFPTPQLLAETSYKLKLIEGEVSILLRGGRTSDAVALVDKVLLVQGAKLRAEDVKLLQKARELLAQRRLTRGRNNVDS